MDNFSERVIGLSPHKRELFELRLRQQGLTLTQLEKRTQKQVVAYIVPVEGQVPRVDELQSFLKASLPDYMMPSAFVILEALPLTSSGKVDYRALSKPEGVRPVLETSFVAPCTAVEETVAGIWAQTLGIGQVGIHDNFFELGGHSLLATRIISRLQDAFQIKLPLRYFFDTPTVAGLAASVETIRQTALSLQAPAVVLSGSREEGEL